MSCPPSARAEAGCPDKATPFAQEGTFAHSLAEHMLSDMLSQNLSAVPEYNQLATSLSPDFWKAAEEIEAGLLRLGLGAAALEDMTRIVLEYYVAPVFEDYLDAKAKHPESRLLIEAELKLSSFIPGGFGSSDAVLISDDFLHVYDLKYGRGVKVDADHNPQMMCYALGAVMGPGELSGIQNVSMTILQPRLQHESSWTISFDDLMYWAKHILKPAAEKAWEGVGEYTPGDHCKFCRFAPRCRACALRAQVISVANAQPEMLNDAELATVLGQLERIKSWAARVEEYATTYLADHQLSGWKLVEGRSLRKIADQHGAVNALIDAGFEMECILKEPELRSLADLERMLGKAGKAILKPFIVKPQGKPTLAPESDRRPALTDAKMDFNDIID